jgi:peptidyl-prolyl cis-trans isomerase SurA
MPLNKIQMKFINSRIIYIFLLLFSSTTIIAQEIIRDTVVAPVKKLKPIKDKKIDGIVLGGGGGNSVRCQMLKLLEDKYAHQAIQDSVKVMLK